MKEVIFGVISGIIAGTGMGGGTILILLLSLFSGIGQHIVQGINLIFFIPTSVIAIFMNVKHKIINYKIAITVCISGIVGAIMGSLLSFEIESQNLKKYFGIFLIIIAIFQFYSFFREYILEKKENNINIK